MPFKNVNFNEVCLISLKSPMASYFVKLYKEENTVGVQDIRAGNWIPVLHTDHFEWLIKQITCNHSL